MSSASTHPVRRLSLYCPDLNKNWYNFLITPSMTWEDMIVSIQAAFQYHDPVWLLDINGEPFSKNADVFNLASVQNGEELLIQLREGFRIVGPLDLEVVLYLEESDPGALETTLRKTKPAEKRVHMERLRRRDGIARKNICRIVLPHSEVMELVAAVNKVSDTMLKRTYSASKTLDDISNNWRVRTTEKTKDLTNDLRCLAMIDILSKALSGQHYLGEGFLLAATKARIESGGPSELKQIQETTKDNKAVSKRFDRSKSYKAGKKGEAATVRYNNDADYMGEDAAEAAYPGKGKGKAMGMLAGRLEKTLLPDNHMDSDDDKDDSDYVE
ncbi:unnamed protein product [Alternaria alternata]